MPLQTLPCQATLRDGGGISNTSTNSINWRRPTRFVCPTYRVPDIVNACRDCSHFYQNAWGLLTHRRGPMHAGSVIPPVVSPSPPAGAAPVVPDPLTADPSIKAPIISDAELLDLFQRPSTTYIEPGGPLFSVLSGGCHRLYSMVPYGRRTSAHWLSSSCPAS